MVNEQIGKRTDPLERYYEACMELAIFRMLQEENSKYQPDTDEEKRIKELNCGMIQAELQEIDQKITIIQRNQRFKKITILAVKTAMILALTVGIAFGIAFSADEQFRIRVLGQRIVKNRNGFVDVFLMGNDTILVPDQWTGDYYPAVIPDEWHLVSSESTKETSSALFANQSGEVLKFEVISLGGEIHINSSDAWVSYARLHDKYATVYHHLNGLIEIVWYGEQSVVIVASSEQEAAFQFAEAMKYIKQDL